MTKIASFIYSLQFLLLIFSMAPTAVLAGEVRTTVPVQMLPIERPQSHLAYQIKIYGRGRGTLLKETYTTAQSLEGERFEMVVRSAFIITGRDENKKKVFGFNESAAISLILENPDEQNMLFQQLKQCANLISDAKTGHFQHRLDEVHHFQIVIKALPDRRLTLQRFRKTGRVKRRSINLSRSDLASISCQYVK